MTLTDEYRNQFRWRPWPQILEKLPPFEGRTVLDLGCGIGDQAAELATRGARVIGIDTNQVLLDAARSRGIPNADFREGDLRRLPSVELPVDGIWCSFAAAYFPGLDKLLTSWRALLSPGGWIALTEVDDLFAHEPLDPHAATILAAYRDDALAANRYDFRMGRKLQVHLEGAGFHVVTALKLRDYKLAFDGPAAPGVLEAWTARLARMTTLHQFCGDDFDHVSGQFLAALAHPRHRSNACIYSCTAIMSNPRGSASAV